MRVLGVLLSAGPIAALGLAILAAAACGGDGEGGDGVQDRPRPEKTIPGIESESVATAGDRISGMAFAPDGRLFLAELSSGNIRVISASGELLPEPFAHIDIRAGTEWGLLGIAVDPAFEENHYVYAYFIQPIGDDPSQARPALMRFTEAGNRGENPETLIEFPMANPEVQSHVGGGIQFGPDGYLYISIGETQREELAQDLSHPFGKILRLTRDGEPAPDNPFADDPDADPRVYAYGLRNSFGIAFDPESGRLYAADNGDLNCDELNVIEAGKNYGWPQSFHRGEFPCQNPGAEEAIYNYHLPREESNASSVAATGVAVVSGEKYPALGDGGLVCEFKTFFMHRLQLGEPNQDTVTDDSVVVEDCSVAVTTSPDGTVYYTNDGEVRRLPPQ